RSEPLGSALLGDALRGLLCRFRGLCGPLRGAALRGAGCTRFDEVLRKLRARLGRKRAALLRDLLCDLRSSGLSARFGNRRSTDRGSHIGDLDTVAEQIACDDRRLVLVAGLDDLDGRASQGDSVSRHWEIPSVRSIDDTVNERQHASGNRRHLLSAKTVPEGNYRRDITGSAIRENPLRRPTGV